MTLLTHIALVWLAPIIIETLGGQVDEIKLTMRLMDGFQKGHIHLKEKAYSVVGHML